MVGTKMKIRWTSTGIDTGQIALKKADAGPRTIASKASSKGNKGENSFDWMIPATVTAGPGCRVTVMSVANTKVQDASNADFSIEAPPQVIKKVGKGGTPPAAIKTVPLTVKKVEKAPETPALPPPAARKMSLLGTYQKGGVKKGGKAPGTPGAAKAVPLTVKKMPLPQGSPQAGLKGAAKGSTSPGTTPDAPAPDKPPLVASRGGSGPQSFGGALTPDSRLAARRKELFDRLGKEQIRDSESLNRLANNWPANRPPNANGGQDCNGQVDEGLLVLVFLDADSDSTVTPPETFISARMKSTAGILTPLGKVTWKPERGLSRWAMTVTTTTRIAGGIADSTRGRRRWQ